jgi:hypothetical protein
LLSTQVSKMSSGMLGIGQQVFRILSRLGNIVLTQVLAGTQRVKAEGFRQFAKTDEPLTVSGQGHLPSPLDGILKEGGVNGVANEFADGLVAETGALLQPGVLLFRKHDVGTDHDVASHVYDDVYA